MQYCLKNIFLILFSTLTFNDISMNGILKQLYGILAALAVCFSGAPCNATGTNSPALPFPVGEELFYRMYWGIIPVGTTSTRTEWTEENGRKLLAIRYRTQTNRLFDQIYPVNDTADSIVDPATFLPVRFSFVLTRRRSRSDKTITFDHARLKAIMVSNSTGGTNEIAIAADTRDIISLLYSYRRTGLQPNRGMKHRFMADTGLLDINLKTYDYEKIDVDIFGKVSCLRLEPIAKLDTLLVENGKVMSWIAPERCLATKMIIRAPLANVSIELHEVRGPGDDFWSTIMHKKKGSKDTDSAEKADTNSAQTNSVALLQ